MIGAAKDKAARKNAADYKPKPDCNEEENNMKNNFGKRVAAGALAAGMGAALLSGCGAPAVSSTSTAEGGAAAATTAEAADTSSPATLKVLFNGPKPDGFDAVYQEFLTETKDTLNTELEITFVEHADYKDKLNLEMTSGSDYDLVFEAPWMHLKDLAADDYYADLSSYFNNDAYPGLKASFSEEVMDANKWYGQMCYIPLARAYGTGIPNISYRQDWAEDWGIGTIDSMDKLEAYWAKAKENGITPLSVIDTRGFYQLYMMGGGTAYPSTADRVGTVEAGLQPFAAGGGTYWVYVKDNKVAACAMEGSGDENFKDFPEGYNYDFGVDRFNKFAEWQSKGYVSPDSMTCKDADTPFWSGQAASKIGTLDDIEKDVTNMATYSPDAKMGNFVYIDCLRNREDGSYPTTYGANNGLAIPASSKNIDRTMSFLDWMFGDAAHHDLFELGLEGTDWEAVGDDQFTDLTGYSSDFPGYAFTWNPNFVKFSSIIPEDVLKYRVWETQETSYVKEPVCGFSFDTSSSELSTATAQAKAIADMVATTKLHGILSDGSTTYASMAEMLKTNTDACMAAGADKIQAALVEQLDAYMAENPQT